MPFSVACDSTIGVEAIDSFAAFRMASWDPDGAGPRPAWLAIAGALKGPNFGFVLFDTERNKFASPGKPSFNLSGYEEVEAMSDGQLLLLATGSVRQVFIWDGTSFRAVGGSFTQRAPWVAAPAVKSWWVSMIMSGRGLCDGAVRLDSTF
jgi:hypothetical protein